MAHATLRLQSVRVGKSPGPFPTALTCWMMGLAGGKQTRRTSGTHLGMNDGKGRVVTREPGLTGLRLEANKTAQEGEAEWAQHTRCEIGRGHGISTNGLEFTDGLARRSSSYFSLGMGIPSFVFRSPSISQGYEAVIQSRNCLLLSFSFGLFMLFAKKVKTEVVGGLRSRYLLDACFNPYGNSNRLESSRSGVM